VENVYRADTRPQFAAPMDAGNRGAGDRRKQLRKYSFRKHGVFDFVKESTRRLAYRAIGQKPVHRDTFNQDEINEFVHHMLES